MSYSTIIKRKCKCGCGKNPSLSFDGWNYECAPQEIRDKVGTKRMAAQKRKNKRLSIARQLRQVQDENNPEKKLTELWFAKIAAEIRQHPYCVECGNVILSGHYRSATAHIIPKKIFPSVATHPLNYLVLCASNGCHDKTHRLDPFSKMNCFKEAVERFKVFYPYIKEKNKLLNDFIEYANKV